MTTSDQPIERSAYYMDTDPREPTEYGYAPSKVFQGQLAERDKALLADRTKLRVEQDNSKIIKMYLQGKRVEDIAIEMSNNSLYRFSVRTIQTVVKNAALAWRNEYLGSVDALKAREIAKIAMLEQTAWLAWEKSLEKRIKTFTEKSEDSVNKKAINSSAKVKREEVDALGDFRYLQVIQWCITERVKILGLAEPGKIEINWREEARIAGVKDPEAMFNAVVSKFIDANVVDSNGNAE